MSEESRGEQGIEYHTVSELKQKLLEALAEEQISRQVIGDAQRANPDEVQRKWGTVYEPRQTATHAKVEAARTAWVNAITREYEIGKGVNVKTGKYQVVISFPKEKSQGTTATYVTILKEKPSLADLEMNVRTEISFIGLHNFGLKLDETGTALVAFEATHTEDPAQSYQSACIVDGAGHIVRSQK